MLCDSVSHLRDLLNLTLPTGFSDFHGINDEPHTLFDGRRQTKVLSTIIRNCIQLRLPLMMKPRMTLAANTCSENPNKRIEISLETVKTSAKSLYLPIAALKTDK